MSEFTIEDIPKIAAETPEPLATPVTGIPQSTVNPLLDVFGQPDYRDDHEKAMDAWRQESATALDAAVIDPKSYGDERVPHGFTPDEWRKTRVVDDFMRLHMDGEAPPMDLSREFTRARLAQQVFGGAGAESDDALFGEITKAATGRKDSKALVEDLRTSARTSGTVGDLGEQGGSFVAWRDAAKKKPGYNPEGEADYLAAWHQTRRQAKDQVAPFKAELAQVWKAMKAGGAGSPSEIVKSLGADLLLGGGGDGEDTIDELQKKDAGAVAFEAYDKLSEEDRPAFLDGLAVLIQQFPKEDRPALLATWGKQFGGVVDSMFRGAAARFTEDGMQQWIDQEAGKTRGPWAATDEFKAQGKIRTDESLKQRNFMDAVRKMERDEYAPTQFYSDPSKDVFSTRTLEQGFYGSASAVASVAVMATPYIGYPVLALAMEDFAYADLRDNARRSGASELDASRFADENKTLAAVPQLGIEILQNKLALGKLPAANKVLIAMGDSIKNRLLRGVVKATAVGLAETGVEEIQYLTPYVVQDLSHALEADTGISAAVWSNGKNGALDGFWTRQATTFLSMLPLGGAAAMGGLNAEARQAAFARSSPTELEAFGISPDGIAAIQGAQGPASLASAIESAMETRDPNSETAQAAVGALKLQLASQRQAQADRENLGYEPPSLVRSAAGITVFDADGQELGTAPDLAGAVRISNVHTAALEDMTSEYVASLTDALEKEKATAKRDALGTLMEATDAAVKLDPQSTMNLEMRAFDPLQASPGMAASYAQQVALKEKAEGGSGDIARSVLGYSVTEFAQGQRQTVNTIFESASVTDAFHETAHGLRRGAHKAGTLTLKHDIALLRSEDTILAGKFAKSVDGKAPGVAMRFIPEGLTDEMLLTGAIPAEMIPPEFHGNGKLYVEKLMDEGVSEITESEVFRPKKGQGKGRLGIGRGVVSRNITALTKLMPGVIGDWVAYFRAVRAQWGLATSRTVAMRGAERRGEWDRSTRDAYLDKLLGLDAQTEHEAGVQTELDRIMGLPDEIADDDIPFSIGRGAVLSDFSDPNTFYRVVVGDEAFQDIVNSGQVRTNANNKGGNTLAERMAARPTAFPSFSKGKASTSYAQANPNHYIVTTQDPSIQPSTQGRHGKGTTMFPTDSSGNPMKSIDGGKVSVYKHTGEGNYELVYAKGELIGDDIPFSIGSRYQGFRLRPDGPTRYVKSNTGVLYPDSHEIKTHTAPPGTQVDKGLWSRLVDDGRRTDLPPERETAATVAGTGIIDQITRHAKSADRSKPFWPWFVGTLNGDDFRGMDPVDILDEVVEVLHLESPVSEQGVSQPLVYAQISQDGAVLVADTVTGEFSFGVLPTAEELAEAQFIHDSNPSEYPSFSIGPARDSEYLALAKDPKKNQEALQKMVDEAASKATTDISLLEKFDMEELPKNGWMAPNGNFVKVGYQTSHNNVAAEILGFEPPNNTEAENIQFYVRLLHLGWVSFSETSGGIAVQFKMPLTSIQRRNLKDAAQYKEGEDAELIADEEKVKIAAIVKESGNVIPLSQRFNPQSDSISYSIGPAKVADIMAGNALKRITDPRRRTQVMSRIARDFDAMRLQIDRMASLSGIRRSKGDLRREAMAREDLRAEELIGDVHRRFGEIMADEDLVKIKSQPVHAALADPDSPLRGRLKSKAAAIREHPDMFQLHRAGDYDGSDGVSRSVFGGQRMPDQAAQELYDEGLISEPTADALWEALLSEQKTVKGMKELLEKAKEQIREAKAQAKQEANEWLATQGKDQEVNFSDKEEIRRSLRMLDAILLALPPEIRGKIGGYTQISMIATDEARLAYLKDKLAKADKELETFLRVEYAAEWEALLKKAAPATNEAGQRPTGSIAADAYDIFRVAEAAMGMSFAEGEAEADKWDAIADHPDTELKDVDMARVKAQMIRLTMNWHSADAARREQAVLEGEKIYYNGLLALKVENSRRRERLGVIRDSAVKGTGKTGHRMEREAAKQVTATKLGAAKAMAWEFLSFGQVVNVLFGETSAAAQWFNSREIAASNAAHDGFQAKANALESLFDTLSGNRFDGEKLRHRMATQKTIKVKDVLGVEQTFTDAEAITFLLMYRQEDGKRHLQGLVDEDGNILSEWAWDDAGAATIEAGLSKEGKAAMAFLGQSYGEEYGRINAVFRRIWNVSMPRHKMYAPLSVKPVQGKGDTIMDPVSGDTMGSGMTPGSLKNRSFSAIAEPDFKDAFAVYLTHARQMEHFIAYGEFARDALGIVNRRETRNAIEAAGGADAAGTLSKWIDYFAMGGVHGGAMGGRWNSILGGMLGRLSQAALVGRVSVLCMQSLQLAAASFKMPTGAFLTRFAKLTAGRLQWGDTIQSEYVQRRIQQLPPVVRDMMQGMASGTPNRAKFLAGKVAMSIPGADALFTAGTYAMFYDYHLGLAKKSKMANPEAQAHAEAERLTDQVAQPVRTGARSWLEVANAGNPAFRAAWNFSSDPRQKMSWLVYAAMRRDTTGKEKVADVTFTAAKLWIIGGVMQALLRTILRDLRNDDDDEIFDERYWDPARLALQVGTGPLGAVPFLGGMTEDATYKLTGQFMPQGGMLAFLDQAAGLPKKWAGGKFEPIKDVEALTTAGAGLSGTSAAAASAMHLIRDVVGFIENLEGPD